MGGLISENGGNVLMQSKQGGVHAITQLLLMEVQTVLEMLQSPKNARVIDYVKTDLEI